MFVAEFSLLTISWLVHRKAATSTIPNAGFGVFIKVKPPKGSVVAEGERFTLHKGEMIDLGVYGNASSAWKSWFRHCLLPVLIFCFLPGPLRREDVRDDVVVLVKSFIFESTFFSDEQLSLRTGVAPYSIFFAVLQQTSRRSGFSTGAKAAPSNAMTSRMT